MQATTTTTFRLDAAALLDKIDEDHRRAFIRLGGYIRTTARRSMRRTKNKNLPAFPAPQPPRARLGTIRDLYQFAYDTAKKRLVAGPEVTTKQGRKPPVLSSTLPTHIQEAGGNVKVGPKGMVLSRSIGRGKNKTVQETTFAPGQTIRIPARPYSAPALERAIREEKLKKYWEAIA